MTNPQTPTPTPKADAPAQAEFTPLHEDDYISEELSEKIGEEIWVHKPTGRPYFPSNEQTRSLAQLPLFDHDDPFLQFLRGEIEL